MAFCNRGKAIEARHEIGMLAGLHQAEMTFRQRQGFFARQRAHDRDRRVQVSDRFRHERAMPWK